MIDLVHKRHDGDGWIVFRELGSKAGAQTKRWADAMALGIWASTKYEAHLYEFKISREDLKRELRDPSKVEGVGKYCTYWWLVVSDEKVIADLVIPEAWGIIMPKARGGSRIAHVLRKAPRQKPKAVDATFAISMIRNIQDTWISPKKHSDLVEKCYRLENPIADGDGDLKQKMAAADRSRGELELELTRLKKSVTEFETASGVSLSDRWNSGAIGDAVKLALELQNDVTSDQRGRVAINRLSTAALEFERRATEAAEAALRMRKLVGVTEHTDQCRSNRQWSRGPHCSCGALPMSEVEAKLAADDRDGDSAPSAPADGDDDQGSTEHRGDAGAPEQDAGLLLRD